MDRWVFEVFFGRRILAPRIGKPPRKCVSSELDFHWFLADQWDLETEEPQIWTPHSRVTMSMCSADYARWQKSKLFPDWLKRTNFMLFLATFSVIKPLLSVKGTLEDELVVGECRQISLHSFETKVLFRPASNEWVWKCIVILTLWLFIKYLKPLDEFWKIMKIQFWTIKVHIN